MRSQPAVCFLQVSLAGSEPCWLGEGSSGISVYCVLSRWSYFVEIWPSVSVEDFTQVFFMWSVARHIPDIYRRIGQLWLDMVVLYG
ncbi:hypothetical protein RRG08_009788 [Elysia crispata]|uniref:Uncharacterized protein n=1 Tax=Elysia crispata TaxID=231223 RepID=A0AAE0ZRT5_9GAST|nr:hypothetical protein RRG08_009788 [Elysia crispata]